jgi:hypothetical protein
MSQELRILCKGNCGKLISSNSPDGRCKHCYEVKHHGPLDHPLKTTGTNWCNDPEEVMKYAG